MVAARVQPVVGVGFEPALGVEKYSFLLPQEVFGLGQEFRVVLESSFDLLYATRV